MASIIKIELNLVPGAAPGGIMPRVRVSQGDALDRILQFELYDGSEVADLTDVVSIFFGGQKPDGNGFTVLCTAQNNLVTGILTPQSTVLAGLIPCKLYLTTATGSVRSATFDMQIDPDPLNNAGTSDTDITAIVAAAGNYAAEAQQSAEDAAASAETAATAGATAGEAAAQAVVNNKLDKVGGDSAADIITFTSSDDATESGIIIPSGGEETVPALVTGATHAGLLGNLSKIALNSRKLINTVKRIWTSVANSWASGAEYKAGNVVTYINGHTYICILDHTSSSSITPLNTTYWEDKTLGDMIASLNSNLNTNFYSNSGNTKFPAANTQYTIYTFIAPKKGIYLLNFDVTGTYNSSIFLNVKKNSQTIASNTASWTGSPTANTACIVNLTTSDQITFVSACSAATNTQDRIWHFNTIRLNE
jgi:hypothetical protein